MGQIDLTTPNSKWQSFKLRMALLRIWFMKNIVLWIQIFAIVCVVCMLTGKLTEATPILGPIVYPLFKPLIDQIESIIENQNISRGIMSFLAAAISILISVSMFTIKARSIAQNDIKSDKLKIALIKAKLYFNQDGKLVKRVEKLTGQDFDGDGEANGEIVMNKGPISGMFSAIKELFIISTVKLDGDEKQNKQNYKKALKQAKLENASESLNELEEIVRSEGALAALDASEEIMDKSTTKTEMDRVARKHWFRRTREFFKDRREKRKYLKSLREKEKEETCVNNEDNEMPQQPKPNPTPRVQNNAPIDAGDYLNSLRH